MHNLSRLLLACIAAFALASVANAQYWEPGPTLPLPIKDSPATVLGSDIWLFAGRTTANAMQDSVRVLHTATGSWEAIGQLPWQRANHMVVQLGGKFYLAGGFIAGSWPEILTHAYDPLGVNWIALASLPTGTNNAGHCADGEYFYIFGGGHTDAPRNSVLRYDPLANQWVSLANMPRARKGATSVHVDGKVYVMGGHTALSGINDALASVDVYDIATNTWSNAPDLPVAMTVAASAVINGRVYVMGGADGTMAYGKLDQVFSLRSGAVGWRVEPSLPLAVAGPTAVALGDSVIYLIGGESDTGVVPSVARLVIHEPDIVSVTDVPNDQGGRMTLRWLASNYDRGPSNPIGSYWIWREVPAQFAQAALAAGAILGDGDPEATGSRGVIRTTVDGTNLHYWEFVGSQPARGFPAYSYTVPTLFDSLANSNPWTRVMVEADFVDGREGLASAPDSGYSVDDLAPPAPGPIAYRLTDSGLVLSWLPSQAPDLAGYRVYFGTTAGFEPSEGTHVATVGDTSYASVIAGAGYFKVRGVDVHGNEGPESSFMNVLDVGDGPAPGLALASPVPNPASGPARVRYTLGKAGYARLALYDVGGRECRVLASGMQPAGEHSLVFALDNGRGSRLGAGVYFLKLESQGQAVTKRLAIIH